MMMHSSRFLLTSGPFSRQQLLIWGGRPFSHPANLTRQSGGSTEQLPCRPRTLRPFSAFGKADVDRLIRRAKKRSLSSASECLHIPKFQRFPPFRMFAFPPKTACFTLFVLAECQQLLILAVGHFPTTSAFVSMFVQYLMTNCLSLVNSYYETLALNAFLKITIITDFQCHF